MAQTQNVPLPRPRPKDAAAATKPTKPTNPVQTCKDDKVTVVIDPGHGDIITGSASVDSGAVYPTKGKIQNMEKDIALAVSKAIRDALQSKPHIKAVILTREGDVTTPTVRWTWRTNVARNNNAQIFIDVHVNSFDDASVHGHIVAYWSPSASTILGESKKLATSVDTAFTTIAHKGKLKGPLAAQDHYGIVAFADPGPVKAAIFIELGFIGNDADRAKMTDAASVKAMGGEIADGVSQYIEANVTVLCTP